MQKNGSDRNDKSKGPLPSQCKCIARQQKWQCSGSVGSGSAAPGSGSAPPLHSSPAFQHSFSSDGGSILRGGGGILGALVTSKGRALENGMVGIMRKVTRGLWVPRDGAVAEGCRVEDEYQDRNQKKRSKMWQRNNNSFTHNQISAP